jgi:hypothetical protein
MERKRKKMIKKVYFIQNGHFLAFLVRDFLSCDTGDQPYSTSIGCLA